MVAGIGKADRPLRQRILVEKWLAGWLLWLLHRQDVRPVRVVKGDEIASSGQGFVTFQKSSVLSATPLKVIIIGAGVAGLVAARHLEEAGISPIIIDAEDRVGGRLKTDREQGFLLDRGFQVLLTEYPEVKRYLDLEALAINTYRPGAHVHTRTQHFRFVDPLREPAQVIRSALSPLGVLADKVKLGQLGLRLRAASNEACFEGYESKPTIDYLREIGFTEQIIERFFRPFFGGIFLEQELATPAAMFRYIFKMFGSGSAALPAGGIEAIPRQLAAQLQQSEFRFNQRVRNVNGNQVTLDDGSQLSADGIILACAPDRLVEGLSGQTEGWKSTTNLYYYSSRRLRENRLINLVFDPTSTINTFTVLDEVSPNYRGEKQGGSLISITLKKSLGSDEGIAQVEQDFLRHSRLPSDALTFLRRYNIERALPKISQVAFKQDPSHSRLTESIFLAGDQQLNGSLDAAMRSGRLAALGLLEAAS
ncbi:amine oxidase [Lewinellaceae bacterium SD302]|nr:amine oxidase [Lewinellaceae bacterium SD302]